MGGGRWSCLRLSRVCLRKFQHVQIISDSKSRLVSPTSRVQRLSGIEPDFSIFRGRLYLCCMYLFFQKVPGFLDVRGKLLSHNSITRAVIMLVNEILNNLNFNVGNGAYSGTTCTNCVARTAQQLVLADTGQPQVCNTTLFTRYPNQAFTPFQATSLAHANWPFICTCYCTT